MKNLITALCILTLFVGCKEEENPVPDFFSGTASALVNGEEWDALSYSADDEIFPNSFGIAIQTRDHRNFLREFLGIGEIKSTFDVQLISSTNGTNPDELYASYATFLDDGDVLGDFYQLDTTATNNFIQITNYDSDRAEIVGVFEISFILNRAGGDSENPPEKLVFTEGKFKVKVEREWFE